VQQFFKALISPLTDFVKGVVVDKLVLDVLDVKILP